MDGRGVPLSLVVTGANRHDVTQVEAVLAALASIGRAPAPGRRPRLCADAGYRGRKAEEAMERHGYAPKVKGRGDEARELRADPSKKARRWVVEAAHGWFNKFRKLLVRYEKLERSYLALCHLAAAIIVFRKVRGEINIIYG